MDWERFNELIALDQSGKTEEALHGLVDLVRSASDPEDKASVLLTVSACQKELRRYQDARRTLAEARSIAKPGSDVHPRALFRDATMDVLEGNWRSALKKLDSIVRDFPRIIEQHEHQDLNEEVRRFRGMALYNLGRTVESRSLLEAAITVDYEKPTSLYYLGRCSYDLGDLDKAKEYLREALRLELNPIYQPSAHYVLGLAYHWKGQHAWAIREFEWCLEHDEEGRVAKWKILTGLMNASRKLGLDAETQRYSKMLQGVERTHDARPES